MSWLEWDDIVQRRSFHRNPAVRHARYLYGPLAGRPELRLNAAAVHARVIVTKCVVGDVRSLSLRHRSRLLPPRLLAWPVCRCVGSVSFSLTHTLLPWPVFQMSFQPFPNYLPDIFQLSLQLSGNYLPDKFQLFTKYILIMSTLFSNYPPSDRVIFRAFSNSFSNFVVILSPAVLNYKSKYPRTI